MRGADVVLVSSGSIALGRKVLGLPEGALTLEQSQAAAAVGQIRLARAYEEVLAPHGITTAQVLVTLEDTEDRRRYLNAAATLDRLVQFGAAKLGPGRGPALMTPERRAFYEYHAALMEPWDGPASVCFTDGRQIGATLDRNGLRPARFCVTKDDIVCLASESGVLPFAEEDIVRKWRLQPGKMLLIDLDQGRIIEDDELKADLANAEPYAEWLHQAQYKLADITAVVPELAAIPAEEGTLLQRQQAFGYTQEDVTRFLEPMAVDGDDPIGSMGTDTPIAVLSDRARLLYDYFKQNFAQVTNPPIDPIREELVMSLVSMIGPRPNLLGRHAGMHKRLEVAQPVLTNAELEKIRSIEELLDGASRTATLDTTWPAAEGAAGLEKALDRICAEATDAVLAQEGAKGTRRLAIAALKTDVPMTYADMVDYIEGSIDVIIQAGRHDGAGHDIKRHPRLRRPVSLNGELGRQILIGLGDAPVFALIFATGLAALASSSLATVLLTAALGAKLFGLY